MKYPISFVVFFLALSFTSGCRSTADGHASSPRPAPAPVIIVGAGLTGLSTAYELKKAGIPALVLEADTRLGGRVETISYPDGATAEAHMEEYWERSPAVALLRELKLPLADDVAHSSVRLLGKIRPYKGEGDRDTYLKGVFTPAETKAFLDWNKRAWKIYEALEESHFKGKALPPELQALTKLSFKDFIAKEKLPRAVSEWIRVTLEPEIAIEWDKIAALDGIDEMRIFLDSPAGFGEKNYHVQGGNSNFIAALVNQIGRENIQSGARVLGIDQSGPLANVRYLQDGKERTLSAKAVVVTVPLYVIDKLEFKPALNDASKKAIATTRFGSYVKVHFRVKKAFLDKIDKKYGGDLFTLLSDSPAGSIYSATGFHEQLAHHQDLVFTLLIHARWAQPYLGLTPEKAGLKAMAEMNKLFPGFTENVSFLKEQPQVRDIKTYIYPTAVAHWPVAEGRSRFDELAQELRKPQGRLYIGGDTTENSHSEGALLSAQRMASQLIEKKAELLAP